MGFSSSCNKVVNPAVMLVLPKPRRSGSSGSLLWFLYMVGEAIEQTYHLFVNINSG